MTAIVRELEEKLNRWNPETAATVEKMVAEIIRLADTDGLHLLRSRRVEQEVLDLLDEPQAR